MNLRKFFTREDEDRIGRHKKGRNIPDPRVVIPGPGPVTTGQALAAYLQHRAAKLIRQRLTAVYSSTAALADRLHQHPTTVQRKFRCEAEAGLGELLGWCIAAGVLDEFVSELQSIADAAFDPAKKQRLPRLGITSSEWDFRPVMSELRIKPLPPERRHDQP